MLFAVPKRVRPDRIAHLLKLFLRFLLLATCFKLLYLVSRPGPRFYWGDHPKCICPFFFCMSATWKLSALTHLTLKSKGESLNFNKVNAGPKLVLRTCLFAESSFFWHVSGHHHFWTVAVQRRNLGQEIFWILHPSKFSNYFHNCLFACSNEYLHITLNILWSQYWPLSIVAQFLTPPGGNSRHLIW
jgi:hypothetical protein